MYSQIILCKITTVRLPYFGYLVIYNVMMMLYNKNRRDDSGKYIIITGADFG